jgi:phytoene dehydrogenase-like protein
MASPWERIKALKAAPLMLKYGPVTLERFAQRFSDPFLRRAFPTIVYDWPGQTMAVLLSFLANLHKGDLGWAVGGSKTFAEAIERRFLRLGGQVRYHSRVRSILVEDGRAVGVRLTDGSEERADITISNANGHTTIFDMLDGRYTNRAIRAYYAAPEDRCEMGIHVSLGVARDLSHEPHAFVLPLGHPVMIADEMRERLYVEPFGFDSTLAPRGKAVLKVVMSTSYRYWESLNRSADRYALEKQRIADTVIDLLQPRFPSLRRQIEVTDVATPITTLRFTGNGHGYRLPMTRMVLALLTGRRLSATLPGLDNFYMVGQWAGIPGVSPVAAKGRDVVRAICRRDGRPFEATPAADRPVERRLGVVAG